MIEQEKEDLLQMFTSEYNENFAHPKDFLPMYEEDTKYRIRDLDLPEKYLKHFLNKVCEIYCPFSEDQPNKKEKYHRNDFYTKLQICFLKEKK
ncbi:MAG: hypothetical protein ACP5DZ_02870 [Bacteroidales bacterium]